VTVQETELPPQEIHRHPKEPGATAGTEKVGQEDNALIP
jgi:hypothetical protein